MKSKRVLLVEDIDDLRMRVAAALTLDAEYSVDVASSLDEALDLVDRFVYHVAVIDVGLDPNDSENKAGLTIVDRLRELDLGTETIILSGLDMKNPEYVAVDVGQRPEVSRVLLKKRLNSFSEVTDAVNGALKDCVIKNFGLHKSATSFLSGGTETVIWEGMCISTLKPKHGFNGLTEFFNRLCEPYTPMLPPLSATTVMSVDGAGKFLSGNFWSKGIGCAVQLVAFTSGAEPIEVTEWRAEHGLGRELLAEVERANVTGVAFKLPDEERRSFSDKL